MNSSLLGEDHVIHKGVDDFEEGHVVLAHGQSVEVLEALRELVGVPVFGEEADGFLVEDFIVFWQA